MKKSQQPKAAANNPIHPTGTPVKIRRPHLWGGCVGTVVSVKDGLHLVKIEARDGEAYPSGFHTNCWGDVLEVWI